MDNPDDNRLLREYVESGSDSAFAAIVNRYVNLVYSAAIRQTGESGLAQEVTQAVFIVLAQKAAKLRENTVLSGWLFQTARYAASDAMKREIRRRLREQEAAQMEEHRQNELDNERSWQEISPFLDEALAKLSCDDRDAIVLRYFENKNLTEVGTNLGISEEAARKRVVRAVEKLRTAFVKRGVAFSVVGLTALISANAVQAAPSGVATSAAIVAKSAGVAASTSAIVKGTMELMAWVKMKTAVVIGSAAALIAVGTIAVVVKESEAKTGVTNLQPLAIYRELGVTPIIAKAVFEIEVNPILARRSYTAEQIRRFPPLEGPQTHILKKDGDTYLMQSENHYSGNFVGTIWMKGALLRMFNPEWNREGQDGGIRSMESMARGSANHLCKWGIAQLQKGGVIWDGESSLTSRYLDDKKIGWLDFNVENGVATSATIRRGKDGPAVNFITYQYDPNFFNGKLPKGYMLYWGDRIDENRRAHTMRIRELELSDKPLPLHEFDPSHLFPSTLTWFYTNNILHQKDSQGVVRRVPTAEEVGEQNRKLVERKGR